MNNTDQELPELQHWNKARQTGVPGSLLIAELCSAAGDIRPGLQMLILHAYQLPIIKFNINDYLGWKYEPSIIFTFFPKIHHALLSL